MVIYHLFEISARFHLPSLRRPTFNGSLVVVVVDRVKVVTVSQHRLGDGACV